MSGNDESCVISVITVCRNAEQTISRTLRSVADQVGVENLIEHLIIDGTSTDKTMEIVKQFSHVRWISELDDGIVDAFNKGMYLARGEYLLYLNADDYLYDSKVLRDAVDFIKAKEHPAWIVGKVLIQKLAEGEQVLMPEGRSFRPTCWSLMLRNRICHQAVLLRRELQLQMRGFDPTFKLTMDYDLWRKLCHAGYHPTYFNRIIAVYSSEGASGHNRRLREEEGRRVKVLFRDTLLKRVLGGLYDATKRSGG